MNQPKESVASRFAEIAGISPDISSERSPDPERRAAIASKLLRVLVLAMGTLAVYPANVASADSLSNAPSAAHNEYCSPSSVWTGGATDVPANLPTACNNTALANTPSPGTVRGPDSTTAAVQNDLNAAACGDTIKITAGVTIGAISLPAKSCDNADWITLESSGVTNAGFPAEGTRATPCVANVASLPIARLTRALPLLR